MTKKKSNFSTIKAVISRNDVIIQSNKNTNTLNPTVKDSKNTQYTDDKTSLMMRMRGKNRVITTKHDYPSFLLEGYDG